MQAGAQASATNINGCNFLLNCCSFHAICGVFYSFAAIFNSSVKQFCVWLRRNRKTGPTTWFLLRRTLFWNPFWSPMTGAFTLDDKQQENKKWAAHVQSAVANRFGNGLICSEDVGPSKGRSWFRTIWFFWGSCGFVVVSIGITASRNLWALTLTPVEPFSFNLAPKLSICYVHRKCAAVSSKTLGNVRVKLLWFVSAFLFRRCHLAHGGDQSLSELYISCLCCFRYTTYCSRCVLRASKGFSRRITTCHLVMLSRSDARKRPDHDLKRTFALGIISCTFGPCMLRLNKEKICRGLL